jgi:hypothetical protein
VFFRGGDVIDGLYGARHGAREISERLRYFFHVVIGIERGI